MATNCVKMNRIDVNLYKKQIIYMYDSEGTYSAELQKHVYEWLLDNIGNIGTHWSFGVKNGCYVLTFNNIKDAIIFKLVSP
jgi:hypothetical protein